MNQVSPAANALKLHYEQTCPETKYVKLAPVDINKLQEYENNYIYLINLKTGTILCINSNAKFNYKDVVVYYSENNDEFLKIKNLTVYKTRCMIKSTIITKNVMSYLFYAIKVRNKRLRKN